jgi:hypothetical protein
MTHFLELLQLDMGYICHAYCLATISIHTQTNDGDTILHIAAACDASEIITLYHQKLQDSYECVGRLLYPCAAALLTYINVLFLQ